MANIGPERETITVEPQKIPQTQPVREDTPGDPPEPVRVPKRERELVPA